MKKSISIKHNEIIRITVDDKVTVDNDTKYDIELTRDQFMNLLLNKKITRNNIFSSWFYLNLDIYNNDLV